MKSNLISKSETNKILQKISVQWKIALPKIKNLMVHHLSEDSKLISSDGLKILEVNEEFLPFLSEKKILEKFPQVMVDMGAVKFMCNGANVMRPGIKGYTDFEKDQIVCVIEESQRNVLAVGKSLVNSSDLESMSKGEVVKNMHYISDKFWEIVKEID